MLEGIINELIKWQLQDTGLNSCCMHVLIDRNLTKQSITDLLSDIYDISFDDGFFTLVTFTKKEEIFQ